MKTEFLKGLGLTDEQISSIMKENGIDVENEKAKTENVKKELKEAKETIATMTKEVQTLKDSNATAEDWKAKFEELDTKVKKDAETAKLEREKAEKEAQIKNRFEAVCVDKNGKPLEFSHDAIKADYFRKFTEAVEDDANKSKSDADVFYVLTKDDKAAFKGIQPDIILPGAQSFGGGSITREQYSKMGYSDRLKFKTEQPELYSEIISKGE